MEGLDEELQLNTQDTEVSDIEKKQKEKAVRGTFCYWTVKGVEHKLKLTTAMVTKLEGKYRTNITNLLITDGIPPLSLMLTVVQAAINPWEHGTSYSDVEKMFDTYLTEGGDQQSFFKNVVIPLMAVSGFFTEKQSQEIMEKLSDQTADF